MGDYYGWDIGGVHLKLSHLFCGGGRASIRTCIAPYEIWRDPAALVRRLRALYASGGESTGAPAGGRTGAPMTPAGGWPARGMHGVTMTAELSDVFRSRAEGVRSILQACTEALAVPPRVLDRNGELRPLASALERPLDVAAANWAATARLVALLQREALLVDVGSTTTDIIPISQGRARPSGRTDMERLLSGELVYSGFLRTPPASLAEAVPLGGGWCRVSPEHFTVMGDVHRILGSIGERDYTTATPDGRGRSREEALARLARLVCAEVAEVGVAALETIARHLADRQIDRLAGAVRQVLDRCDPPPPTTAVSAGAGAFLGEAAARRAGLEVTPLERLLPLVSGCGWSRAAPSAAIAVLMAEHEGELRFTH